MKRINGTYCYKKDIGKVRLTNEDECKILVSPKTEVLLMVADGMGGSNKGDYASKNTIEVFSSSFKDKNGFLTFSGAKSWLRRRIKEANKKIFRTADKEETYKGMGTTFIAALIRKNKLILINSGDSRCYILEDRKLYQLSEDQTVANYLYKSGKIEKNEIDKNPDRHVLYNCIGLHQNISYDLKVIDYTNQTVILCSDGLYNNVSKADIENILNTNDSTEAKVATLINTANFNGGSDNISVCLRESTND